MIYENERLKDNNEAQAAERKHLEDGFAKTRLLTESEFEAEKGDLIDSLDKLTDAKLKVSRVLALTEFKLKHSFNRTKIQWLDSLIHDTIPIGRKLSWADSCMKFNIYAPSHPDSLDIAYVSGSIEIEADIVVYRGKRSKQVGLFGLNLFRYGKRETDAQMFSNCGKIHLKHLEVKE